MKWAGISSKRRCGGHFPDDFLKTPALRRAQVKGSQSGAHAEGSTDIAPSHPESSGEYEQDRHADHDCDSDTGVDIG